MSVASTQESSNPNGTDRIPEFLKNDLKDRAFAAFDRMFAGTVASEVHDSKTEVKAVAFEDAKQ
jgi:hypothetical protein